MQMDIADILKTLPHRYPFLMVDRILELEPGQRSPARSTWLPFIGVRCISLNPG